MLFSDLTLNENDQILETFTRGLRREIREVRINHSTDEQTSVWPFGEAGSIYLTGRCLAGDIGTLIAVTHHGASWTNGTFYIHHNHRGDIVLTRSGTTTVDRYDYSAFGTLHSTLGPDLCRFKFSSKERDGSTGFSYYGYRYYAPQWQRWVNYDPIGEWGGVNVYAFVDNNPVNDLDESGLINAACFGSCMVMCMLGFDQSPPCVWSPPPFASLGATLLASYEAARAKCPKGIAGKACRQAKKIAQKFLIRALVKLGIKGGARAVPVVGWGLIAADATICGFKCAESCGGHGD